MLEFDSADLTVLFLGGTGTISASCVRQAVASGMRVSIVNRGRNAAGRDMPDRVESIVADITDDAELGAALGRRRFDAVVNFLSYDASDADRMVGIFEGRTRQYVHISSGSIYAKPVGQLPISESTPTGPSAHLPYATAKWRAEGALMAAHRESGFPLTIVRPSHTYDDANPPLPGGWTAVDRIARGAAIPVHGDGTSLWTLTHAEDFARGLVGLLGNPRAIGEVFNITGSDVYSWDQIYSIVARRARRRTHLGPCGVGDVPTDRARLVLVGRDDRRHRAQRGVRHAQDQNIRPIVSPPAHLPPGRPPHGRMASAASAVHGFRP